MLEALLEEVEAESVPGESIPMRPFGAMHPVASTAADAKQVGAVTNECPFLRQLANPGGRTTA